MRGPSVSTVAKDSALASEAWGGERWRAMLILTLLPLAGNVPGALDVYNIEWRILDRLAESRSGLRRLYWKWEAAKMRREGRDYVVKDGDVILFRFNV